MTGEQLIAEGHRLARPCVYLNNAGEGEKIAVWGGPGIVAAPEGPYKHWLSIECRFLPGNPAGLAGCLSIYTDEEDLEGGVVALDTSLPLSLVETEGTALFGQKGVSLPPIDAVFQFGSAEVHEWLRSHHWEPEWGFNNNFQGRIIVEEYEAAVQKVSPLYTDSAFAQLGGWNIPWPEDDWEERLEETLLVWTFKDAEPWVEVWRDKAHQMRVIQRVT